MAAAMLDTSLVLFVGDQTAVVRSQFDRDIPSALSPLVKRVDVGSGDWLGSLGRAVQELIQAEARRALFVQGLLKDPRLGRLPAILVLWGDQTPQIVPVLKCMMNAADSYFANFDFTVIGLTRSTSMPDLQQLHGNVQTAFREAQTNAAVSSPSIPRTLVMAARFNQAALSPESLGAAAGRLAAMLALCDTSRGSGFRKFYSSQMIQDPWHIGLNVFSAPNFQGAARKLLLRELVALVCEQMEEPRDASLNREFLTGTLRQALAGACDIEHDRAAYGFGTLPDLVCEQCVLPLVDSIVRRSRSPHLAAEALRQVEEWIGQMLPPPELPAEAEAPAAGASLGALALASPAPHMWVWGAASVAAIVVLALIWRQRTRDTAAPAPVEQETEPGAPPARTIAPGATPGPGMLRLLRESVAAATAALEDAAKAAAEAPAQPAQPGHLICEEIYPCDSPEAVAAARAALLKAGADLVKLAVWVLADFYATTVIVGFNQIMHEAEASVADALRSGFAAWARQKAAERHDFVDDSLFGPSLPLAGDPHFYQFASEELADGDLLPMRLERQIALLWLVPMSSSPQPAQCQ